MQRYCNNKEIMMEYFKADSQPQDVKMLRHQILQFAKDQLQRWEGGEGRTIKNIQLFLAPQEVDRAFYEGAVVAGNPSVMQEEMQRIADDYSIDLPEDWALEILFVEELPAGTFKDVKLPVALYVSHQKQSAITRPTVAFINVIFGVAEHPQYELRPEKQRLCIGREKRVQTSSGFMRENDIAFPSGQHESNNYISRQHARIEWDEESGCYYLYADEGGLPPRNKTKVKTADGELIKLQAVEVGYQLKEGDQILLGESALLQFTYGEGAS